MQKIKFGDSIKFTEVYHSAVYLDIHDSKNFDLKLYDTDKFIEVEDNLAIKTVVLYIQKDHIEK